MLVTSLLISSIWYFFRDVWTRTQGAAIVSRHDASLVTILPFLATHPPYLATHPPYLATHPPYLATHLPYFSTHFPHFATHLPYSASMDNLAYIFLRTEEKKPDFTVLSTTTRILLQT